MLSNTRRRLKRATAVIQWLHRDERGAEGLEKLLIIGAIVIPLLGLLIVFRDKITDWTQGLWENVKEDSEYDPDF